MFIIIIISRISRIIIIIIIMKMIIIIITEIGRILMWNSPGPDAPDCGGGSARRPGGTRQRNNYHIIDTFI